MPSAIPGIRGDAEKSSFLGVVGTTGSLGWGLRPQATAAIHCFPTWEREGKLGGGHSETHEGSGALLLGLQFILFSGWKVLMQ